MVAIKMYMHMPRHSICHRFKMAMPAITYIMLATLCLHIKKTKARHLWFYICRLYSILRWFHIHICMPFMPAISYNKRYLMPARIYFDICLCRRFENKNIYSAAHQYMSSPATSETLDIPYIYSRTPSLSTLQRKVDWCHGSFPFTTL